MSEQTQALTSLADIAALLPGTWTVDDDGRTDCPVLDGPDGMRIYFHRVWSAKHRAEVRGKYPCRDNLRDDERPDRITVSLTRPAAALAKEIERRFLAPYRAAFALSKERKEKSDRAREEAHRIARELAALIGESPSLNSDYPTVYLRSDALGKSYGDIEVSPYTDNTIKMDLRNLTPEQAGRSFTSSLWSSSERNKSPPLAVRAEIYRYGLALIPA